MSNTSRADWLVPIGLIALSAVPIAFGSSRLFQIASGAAVTPENSRFLASPAPVVLHIASIIPYCLIGAFQFAPGFRRRHRGWHRAAGRVLAALGLVAALTGLWMAHFYPWPAGDGLSLYAIRLAFGAAMAVSIVLALFAVRRRDFKTHGAWMMRAYAIGLGAGTQVFTHLPWFILFGKPGEASRAVLMGAGWVINLAVAEWIIHRQRVRAGRASGATRIAPSSMPTGVA